MTDTAEARRHRILIIEDEMFVSMLLEDLLSELDYAPAGPVIRLDDALEQAKNASFDAALLDVNLNGKETYEVADILMERGIPFIFSTGYGAGGMPERFRHSPVLTKPFRRDDLARALALALKRKG